MKRIINYTVTFVIFFVVTNCATTDPGQSQRATSSMDEMQELTNELLSELDETEASLNNLTDQNNANTQDALNSYQENVERVIEMRSEFDELSDEVISESNTYLAQWQKEETAYRNPELREASEERRRDLNNNIDQINEDSGEVSRLLNEYITDIEEIKSYLSKDFTQQGISAVASLTEEVEEHGKKVRNAIQNLQSSVSSAKKSMNNMSTN